MSFTRFWAWRHALYSLLATAQARVALFDSPEHQQEDLSKKAHLAEREFCSSDIYISILSNQPSGSDFCYTFDPNNYDTAYNTFSATSTVTRTAAATSYIQTRHATITSTATVTSTASDTSYSAAQKRAVVTERAVLKARQVEDIALVNAIIERQLGSNGSSVSADASLLASVTAGLSSACTCLHLDDRTVNLTSIVTTKTAYSLDSNLWDVSAVTETDRTTTTTLTVVTTTTVVVSTSSLASQVQSSVTASDTTVVQPTQSVPSYNQPMVPMAREMTCPDSDNQSESVMLSSHRYDYFLLCDTQTSGAGLTPFHILATDNAADCAAACSEANKNLNDAPCRQWSFDADSKCNMFSSGSSYVERPNLITGVLLRVAQGSNSSDASTLLSATSGSVDSSAVMASIDNGVTHVNPPDSATSSAGGNSTCWSSATTYPDGAYSWSWGCTSSSAWYSTDATTFVTEFATTTTIIKSGSGGTSTFIAGDTGGGQSGAGSSGGSVTSTSGSITSSDASPASSTAIVTATSNAVTSISSSLTSGDVILSTGGGGGGYTNGTTEIIVNGTTVTSIASIASSGDHTLSTVDSGYGHITPSSHITGNRSTATTSTPSVIIIVTVDTTTTLTSPGTSSSGGFPNSTTSIPGTSIGPTFATSVPTSSPSSTDSIDTGIENSRTGVPGTRSSSTLSSMSSFINTTMSYGTGPTGTVTGIVPLSTASSWTNSSTVASPVTSSSPSTSPWISSNFSRYLFPTAPALSTAPLSTAPPLSTGSLSTGPSSPSVFTNSTRLPMTGPTGTGTAPPLNTVPLYTHYSNSSSSRPGGSLTQSDRPRVPYTCACLSAATAPVCPAAPTTKATVTKTKTIYKTVCPSPSPPPSYGGYSPGGSFGGGGNGPPGFHGPVFGGSIASPPSASETEDAMPTRRRFALW